jgi:CDP-paratose 2-epimerase
MNVPTTANTPRAVPRILITGGCGFLGCNLADAIAASGRDVTALDNLSRSGSEENADWLRKRHGDRIAIEIADICDENAVRALASKASAILHLAAQVAVTTSVERPLDDFTTNTRGTLNVLETVRQRNPAAPVIFASTNKVYGKLLKTEDVHRVEKRNAPRSNRLTNGVKENTALDLYSPYGCSKGAADQYVHDYARIYGLRTVVLRMSCIYGPRQFGNEDQGWIAHFLRRAILDQPIVIYGDGYQVRDALYVQDAVDAWLGILSNIDPIAGAVFNLGGGPQNSVSLLEVLELISELTGQMPETHFSAWRPGDQPWYVTDNGALSSAIHWRPAVSVKNGLRKLHDWLAFRFKPAIATSLLREARA